MRLSRKERRALATIEDRLTATAPDLAEALRDFGHAPCCGLGPTPPRYRPWRLRWWTHRRVWLLLAGLGSATLITAALTAPGRPCAYQGLDNHAATTPSLHAGSAGPGEPVEIGCR